jgi:hypothetical protein
LIIAIDPGAVNTGVAMFRYDSEAKKAHMFYLKILHEDAEKQIMSVIGKSEPKHTVVLEAFRNAMSTGNFRNRKSANMTAAELATNKLANKIKATAAGNGHELILQEPSILAMGKKWCDYKLPKGHIPDDKSAYIHGVYYMMKAGLIRTTDDIVKFGQAVME